jgi:regulatory LuxR family protein
VVRAQTNPQIAAELFLSQKTVETHLNNIFHKMGVTTRAALARRRTRRPNSDPATLISSHGCRHGQAEVRPMALAVVAR